MRRPARTQPFTHTHLPQRVHDLDEVALRRHHRVDVLVGARRLVDDVRVLAALDACGRLRVVLEREPPLRLAAATSRGRRRASTSGTLAGCPCRAR